MSPNFKQAFNFAKEHALEYFLLIIVQVIITFFGSFMLAIGTMMFQKLPIGTAILAILGTVIMCYGMWQLMLIQGALMYCVCANLKSKDRKFDIKTFLPIIKSKQSEYALYLLFISLVALIPIVVLSLSIVFRSLAILFILLSIVGFIYLIPLFAYSFPAYILKAPGESVVSVYNKVYKILDANGVIIVVLVLVLSFFAGFISGLIPFVSIILTPVVQIFVTIMSCFIYAQYYISRKIVL